MNINLGWVALRMFIECRGTEHYGLWHDDIQHTNKKVTLRIYIMLIIMALLV